MADKDHKKLHAIMIAYPLQGHIIPTVHLAIKLASKGVTITFINTQPIHHQISKSNPPPPPPSSTAVDGGDFFAGARNSGLDIRYATVCDGLPLGFDRSLNHDQFMECLLHVFSAHVDELVGKIVRSELESECPVTCLIADTFFVWPSVIAKKYNLVHVSFWTEPALVLTLYYHLELLRKNGHFASHGEKREGNREGMEEADVKRGGKKRDSVSLGSPNPKKFSDIHFQRFSHPENFSGLHNPEKIPSQRNSLNPKNFSSLHKREDTIDYIPGVRSIKPTDLMSYLQATDIGTVVHRIIYKAFEDTKRADVIVCNTIQELEPETISALNQKKPTYAIGPIFPTGFTKSTVAMSLWSESDCTHWLDTKPHGSVLYISFGSYAHTSKHDILEIAHGLLRSGVSFVWVIRPDIVSSEDLDFLPVGFEANVKGRGVIVPWCCQIDVISHSAIGGFLTHCGWNSILESVWCSVPLICFPLLTDQFTNRKLVVDDWKVGINLCDERSITREEVAEKINRLMYGKTSDQIRKKIKKMRKVLEDALASDGSSQRNFDQFIEDLKIKVSQRNGIATWQHEDASSNHA
ncbi:unnamed protein product [Camellia sinensis]